MRNLAIDDNSRACVFTELGFGRNFSAGDKVPKDVRGIVRITSADNAKAVIRYVEDKLSDGVIINPGDTLWVRLYKELEIVSGKVNIMF